MCTWALKLAMNGVKRRKEVHLRRLRQRNDAVWPGLHCLCSLNDMPLPSKGERINERMKVGGTAGESEMETT